jgi:hypothetical protein
VWDRRSQIGRDGSLAFVEHFYCKLGTAQSSMHWPMGPGRWVCCWCRRTTTQQALARRKRKLINQRFVKVLPWPGSARERLGVVRELSRFRRITVLYWPKGGVRWFGRKTKAGLYHCFTLLPGWIVQAVVKALVHWPHRAPGGFARMLCCIKQLQRPFFDPGLPRRPC